MVKETLKSNGLNKEVNVQVKLNYLKCSHIKANGKKCGHEWIPRKKKVVVCPKCHSYKWNEDQDE